MTSVTRTKTLVTTAVGKVTLLVKLPQLEKDTLQDLSRDYLLALLKVSPHHEGHPSTM